MSDIIRPATRNDASNLAKISLMAGGGTFELLLGDMKRGVTPLQVMTELCSAENTEYSYHNYFVCEQDSKFAGSINYISVADRYKLAPNINPILQARFGFGVLQLIKFFFRARHLKGLNTIKAPKNAMHINDVAVFPEFQGLGLGKLLVQKVIDVAKERSFEYVSLYVWEDNTSAVGFYEKLGFQTAGRGGVRPHSKYLSHTASLLMLFKLTPPQQ